MADNIEEVKESEQSVVKEGEQKADEKTDNAGIVDKVTAEELVDKAVERLHNIRSDQTKNTTQEGNRTWKDLSDQEISHILANPVQYNSYIPGAIAENNRRLEASIMSKVEMAMDLKSAMVANKDAFDPATPFGKEMAKIIGNKSYNEILSDALELATYRIGKNKVESADRRKIVDNLKAASSTAPGSDSRNNTSIPSPANMSAKEFNEMVKKTKLRT